MAEKQIQCWLHVLKCQYYIIDKKGLGLAWFGLVWYMVFNATFNNISVISWWSVLLVEETNVPEENHRPVDSH